MAGSNHRRRTLRALAGLLAAWVSTIFCRRRLLPPALLNSRPVSFSVVNLFLVSLLYFLFCFFHFIRVIRGGGPGTWGVLTDITYKARPVIPFTWFPSRPLPRAGSG